MGLLAGFFKTKKINLLEQISNEFANEEKKKDLLNSPSLDGRQLVLNQDGILSFVIAVLCFEIDFNPKFQSVHLKKEYYEIIEKEKNNKAFQLLHKYMHDYYKGYPSLDKALWNITYTYLETVWGIKEGNHDPILLTVYSRYLSQVRSGIKKTIENSLPDLIET